MELRLKFTIRLHLLGGFNPSYESTWESSPKASGRTFKKMIFELPPGNIKSSSCIPPPKMGSHLANYNLSPTFGFSLTFSADISRNLNQLPFFRGPKTRVLVTINLTRFFMIPGGRFFVCRPLGGNKNNNFPS